MRPNYRFTPQESRPSHFSFTDSTSNLLYNRFLHHSYAEQSPPKMDSLISHTYGNKTNEYYISEVRKDVSNQGMVFGDVLYSFQLNEGKQKKQQTFANGKNNEKCVISRLIQSFADDRRLDTSKNCSISTQYQAPGMYNSRQGEQRFKLYATIPDHVNTMNTSANQWDDQFHYQSTNMPVRKEKQGKCTLWIIGALIFLALTGVFAAQWISRNHQQEQLSLMKIAQSIGIDRNSQFTKNKFIGQPNNKVTLATGSRPSQQKSIEYVTPNTLLLVPINQIYRTAVSPFPESIDLEKAKDPHTYTIYYPLKPLQDSRDVLNPTIPSVSKDKSGIPSLHVSVSKIDPAQQSQIPMLSSLPESPSIEPPHITSISPSVLTKS